MKNEKKMSVEELHKVNKKLILNLIKSHGEISRSQVSSITKLTPPTVTKIIEELVTEDNLVEYSGIGNSSGGRPPVVVRYNGNKNFIIGIDLGATFIRGALMDLNANFVSEIQIPTELNNGLDDIIDRLVSMIDRFVKRNTAGSKIWGVGIGVAGLVERSTKKIAVSPVFGWENLDLMKRLKERITLPVFIENSTRLMALGELNFGEHSTVSNFAIINVGYGIAAGLVLEGRLIKGEFGYAGEFGHITVDTHTDVVCSCGKKGCLEAMASGKRIADLGIAHYHEKEGAFIRSMTENNPALVTAKLLGQAYKKGDVLARKIYNQTTEYLAQAIGSLANLLNVAEVYIGGGVSLNGAFYLDLINEKVKKYLLPPNINIKILPSTFGEQATTIGAACMVLERILILDL